MAFALYGCAGMCNKYNTIQYNTIHNRSSDYRQIKIFSQSSIISTFPFLRCAQNFHSLSSISFLAVVMIHHSRGQLGGRGGGVWGELRSRPSRQSPRDGKMIVFNKKLLF
jgi:hypothetical protein